MIESLMLLGIGVCAGCLLVLAFIPLVHRRATRITTRHMDDATPLAINAIQADKDRLRAEFATSVRRLEVGVEEMRTKAAGHLGEIGRQKMEIQRLRLELDNARLCAPLPGQGAQEHRAAAGETGVLRIHPLGAPDQA
jgi:hypothetical protein